MPEPTIVTGPPLAPLEKIDPARARTHYTRQDATWRPRTFADERSERGEDPRVRVRCDCGRVRPAFAVADLRPLPASVRGGQEWACDACKTDLYRRRGAPLRDRVELTRMLGAPAVVVERLEAVQARRRATG